MYENVQPGAKLIRDTLDTNSFPPSISANEREMLKCFLWSRHVREEHATTALAADKSVEQ